ncbi:hypothetical protein [Pseudomonas mangrovi]|uniref:Uncharacterized protein n=1 Tax=Pseudomonas mangrovi TaxID=2161748 RepID=A0A2T5PF60_9PSED|nr:hypothetical protein [Pseudomonas mangrovi]PTU76364.1 hypothetical protein DBO85_01610 [Pseudomonas mangrovi]
MRRLLRLLKWTFALLLGLPLLAYVALLLINWDDQPPSAEALEMQRILAERPVPADDDNAYVYLLGILAADGVSPMELGRRQLDWAHEVVKRSWKDADPWPPEPELPTQQPPRETRIPSAQKLIGSCPSSEACLPDLAGDSLLLHDWLDSEQLLLQRYLALLQRTSNHVPLDLLDIRMTMPDYSGAFDGQRLLMAQSWLLMHAGDSIAAVALLNQDLTFWRMMQRESDTILQRMIAAAAIRQHFNWGRAVLVQHPEGPLATPASWSNPFTTEDRSLERALAAEWLFSKSMVAMMKADHRIPWEDDAIALFYRVPGLITTPLIRPQTSANDYAAHLRGVIDTSITPLRDLREASEKLRLGVRSKQESIDASALLRDPIGWWFFRHNGFEHFLGYAARSNDIESIRRASLLLVSAVAEKIPDEGMAEYVAGHELIDPYSEEPFGWDAEKGVLLVPLLQQDEPLALPLR